MIISVTIIIIIVIFMTPVSVTIASIVIIVIGIATIYIIMPRANIPKAQVMATPKYSIGTLPE